MANKTLSKKEYLERLVVQTVTVIGTANPSVIDVVRKAIEGAYRNGVESAKKK